MIRAELVRPLLRKFARQCFEFDMSFVLDRACIPKSDATSLPLFTVIQEETSTILAKENGSSKTLLCLMYPLL